MRRLFLILATFLAIWPVRANAEELNFSDNLIKRMCSLEGMLQYKFGQQGVPFANQFRDSFTPTMKLGASVSGFERLRPMSTAWSDRLFGMDYIQDRAGPEKMVRMGAELDLLLKEAGWQSRSYDHDAYADSPTWRWFLPVAVDGEESELTLTLEDVLDETTLSCQRADLAALHFDEAFGKLPPGTPRPSPPESPNMLPPTREACSEPQFIAELDLFMKEGQPNGYLGILLARSNYQAKLATWKHWKLEGAGVSADELFASQMVAFASRGDPLATLQLIDEVLPLVQSLADAQASGDRQAICDHFVELNALFSRMDRQAAVQWDAINNGLDALAVKNGVDFGS